MVESLDHKDDEIVSTKTYDLEPVKTYDGLHTTTCTGSVCARQDHAHYPHSTVYTYDMAKTKGPIHKSINGRATRLLMVLMLSFSGDADMVVTANSPSAKLVSTKPVEEDEDGTANQELDTSWKAKRYWGTLADAGFDANDDQFADVLQGRFFHYAAWAIIHPDDPRYIATHKINFDDQMAESALEQDLAVRMKRRREIEAEMARGVQLADPSTFYFTVNGTLDVCNFVILTRTIFQNEVPNPNLKRFISEKVSQSEQVFRTLKTTSLQSSELRLRFGRHGLSVRKFLNADGLR